jgi:hypothetical protein
MQRSAGFLVHGRWKSPWLPPLQSGYGCGSFYMKILAFSMRAKLKMALVQPFF